MAYIKDTGTPGANNAELPTGAVLDTGAKTLSLEAGTEVQSAVVLEEKQWVILETRNVNGTANLTGECIYTEDSTDLADVLAFVNDVRNRMILLHTTFDIAATHYKTGNVIDIYRGDEATAATLEAADTNMNFTPPALWSIDDLTPFAPSVAETGSNIVKDSGFDNPADHAVFANVNISGSELHFVGDASGAQCIPQTIEELEGGVSYEISITCTARTAGYYRFYIGSQVSGSYSSNVGTFTQTIVCPNTGDYLKVTSMSSLDASFDNFTCERA